MAGKRIKCSSCGNYFTSRFGAIDPDTDSDSDTDDSEDDEDTGPICPTCSDPHHGRTQEPETLECGVCDEEHLGLTQRERRSMAGQSFDAKVCIIESGEYLVHPHDGADLDGGDSS